MPFALKRLLKGSFPRGVSVGLGSCRRRRRSLVHSPVIQHTRNMPYRRAGPNQTQSEIIILRALEAITEPAGLGNALALRHEQMAEVHAAREKLRRPVRFEVRPEALARVIHPVFVGVKNVGFLILQRLRR